jgi:hypothetical protein
MKIKEYRSQFIQELLPIYDEGGRAEVFLPDTGKVSVKKNLKLWIQSWF